MNTERLELEKIINKKMVCLQREQKKIYAQIGSNISTSITVGDQDCVIVYSSLLMLNIVQNTIFEASTECHWLFGTGNTNDIFKAMYTVSKDKMNDLYNYDSNVENNLKFENYKRSLYDSFVLVIETKTYKTLRLDLYKNIGKENKDFEWGLLHTLSHFTYWRKPLSVCKKGSVELPASLLDIIIDTFFLENGFSDKKNNIVFSKEIDNRKCKFVFHHSEECDVYSLITVRPDNK